MAKNSSGQSIDAGSRFANRRAFPRFAFDAHAELSDPIIKSSAIGRVVEISQGGCFVDVPDPNAISPIVQLRIENGGESFRSWARVLYSRGSGVGIRFINMPPDQIEVLMKWLRVLELPRP